ncbi:MAG: hypothetical protein COA79_08620 [Planctomycetota bacterium]|nr:MAG: hypothetical protein COA79_08620 [Planctomycetota bacterium]
MKKINLMLCMLCLFSIGSLCADVKKDMQGYWKADLDALKKSMEKKLNEMPAEQRQFAGGMIKMMTEIFKNFAIHITEKEQIALTPKGEEKKSYEIVKVDGNKVTMKVGSKEVTVLVEKDKLSINDKQMDIVLLRTDKAEYEKRKKGMAEAAEKLKGATGLPPPPPSK